MDDALSTDVTVSEPRMPAAIAAGIVKVIGSVKRLAKLDENKFAHYNYASIDTFLEAMGPLLAEAEIFILPEEESLEVVETEKRDREGTTGWLKMHWSFLVGHKSGVLYGPLHRSILVPAAGAQAFGSAQSYSLKQFMRGLFLIPTGDADDADDADQFKKYPLPQQRQQARPSRPAPKPPAPKAPAPKPVAPKADLSQSIKHTEEWSIDNAKKPSDLVSVAAHVRDTDQIDAEAKKTLLDRAAKRMMDFAVGSIKKAAVEDCDRVAAWYAANSWFMSEEQRRQIADGFTMIKEAVPEAAEPAENLADKF